MASVSRVSRDTDAAPWPDDAAPSPPNRGSRPRKWIASDDPPIHDPTVTGVFLRGLLAGPDGFPVSRPDGSPVPVIVRTAQNKDGESSYSVIWIGTWEVIGRYRVYTISQRRGLTKPEWHEWVTIRSTDRAGNVHIVDIAAGDFRQQVSKATWLDALGAGFTGRASFIRDYTRILAMQAETETMIRGTGPFYFDDGSPSCTLSKKLAFAARSVIFDADGPVTGIRIDPGMSDAVDYYDLTPASGITAHTIREGCELIKLAYDECPAHPAIPAAFIGQQMTAFAVAVRPEFHSGILLSGLKGSGKTKYAVRWDSIQARAGRITRGPLSGIKPVINLGDRRGTGKGTGYRITKYGGFAVTMDDVLKDGDTEIKIREQSQLVRDLVSSYESGGAPLGYVDRTRNEITDRESPALHSSVKIMSEIPLIGESTLERLIVLPRITETWDTGQVFNRDIADTLSSPDNRESQHLAYSAYVQWAFTRIDDLNECLEKAVAETATWEVPARTQEKYAAVLAGHFMFGRFCEIHDIDISGKITGAVTALRDCARAQARKSIPLAQQFAADLRRAVMLERVSFPGPPAVDPDGVATNYGLPWVMGEPVDDNGTPRPHRVMPDISLAEIGMVMFGDGKPTVPARAMLGGYSMPPRDTKKNGGINGNPLTAGWYVACKRERFAEIVKIVSQISGRAYDPDSVMGSLRGLKRGAIFRVFIAGKQERTWNFDLMWTLKNRED